jgi:hypothetical protein
LQQLKKEEEWDDDACLSLIINQWQQQSEIERIDCGRDLNKNVNLNNLN